MPRADALAGFRDCHDVAVAALGEGEPRGHLVGPADDLVVPGLVAELACGGPGRLGGDAHPEVVLEAADEQREPSCGDQQLGVDAKTDRLAQQLGNLVEPAVGLGAERCRVAVGYSQHSSATVACSESSVFGVVSEAWMRCSSSAVCHGVESRLDA